MFECHFTTKQKKVTPYFPLGKPTCEYWLTPWFECKDSLSDIDKEALKKEGNIEIKHGDYVDIDIEKAEFGKE